LEKTLNFQTFVALFNLFRKFKHYAVADPTNLNEEEFYELLSGTIPDRTILYYIDNFYLTTMGDLDEIYQGKVNHGEEDFLIQFLETKEKS